jgi:hypothetical protein
MNRETDILTDNRWVDRYRYTDRQTFRQIEKWPDRETEADGWMDEQTDRQTDG